MATKKKLVSKAKAPAKKIVVKKAPAKKVAKIAPKKAVAKAKVTKKPVVKAKIVLKKAVKVVAKKVIKPTPKKAVKVAPKKVAKPAPKKVVKVLPKKVTKPIAKKVAAKPTKVIAKKVVTKTIKPIVKKALPPTKVVVKPVIVKKAVVPIKIEKPIKIKAEKPAKPVKPVKVIPAKKPLVAPTTFAKAISVEQIKQSKEPNGKFEMEFVIRASEDMVYEYISTESGLSEWFCDDVNIKDNVFTFNWDGQIQQARLVKEVPPLFIRYQWLDKNDGSYFEFRTQKDDLTNDVSLIITDFADNKADEESARLLWESQIDKLLHVLGSFF